MYTTWLEEDFKGGSLNFIERKREETKKISDSRKGANIVKDA